MHGIKCSNKEMLQCSFKKCGINVKENGSVNVLVHIEGITEYVMPEVDKEIHLDTSTDEGDDLNEGDLEAMDAEETDEEQ